MSKKKKSKNASLLRKGIALVVSVVTFIFLFLEMIAVKVKYLNILKDTSEVETEGVKFSEFLFSEDYEIVRESFSTATTVMWIVFGLVLVSVALTFVGLVMKKSA